MPLRISRRTTDRGRPPGLASGSNRLSRFHWVRVRSEGYRFDFTSDRLGFMPNYRADLAFRTPFKIAELNRTALRQLGVSWLNPQNNNILGQTIGGAANITGVAGAPVPITQSTTGSRGV